MKKVTSRKILEFLSNVQDFEASITSAYTQKNKIVSLEHISATRKDIFIGRE